MGKAVFIVAAVVIPAVIVAGVVYVAAVNLLPPRAATAAISMHCRVRGAAHRVMISNGAVTPVHTDAVLCDTLTITNADNRYRIVAFGPHDDHQPYDGVTEKLLSLNQSFTVILNKPGAFTFHDHLDETAAGSFTVTQR
jgi:hypothetical protein